MAARDVDIDAGYEIRTSTIASAGLGVFATRDYARGDTVVANVAPYACVRASTVHVSPKGGGGATPIMPSAGNAFAERFMTASQRQFEVDRLPNEMHARMCFRVLCRAIREHGKDGAFAWLCRQFICHAGANASGGVTLDTASAASLPAIAYFLSVDERVVRSVAAICANNAFNCSDNVTTYNVGANAVYVGAATRFNHRCVPTAVYHFDGVSWEITVSAICDIRRGDEIFISYAPVSLDSDEPPPSSGVGHAVNGFACHCVERTSLVASYRVERAQFSAFASAHGALYETIDGVLHAHAAHRRAMASCNSGAALRILQKQWLPAYGRLLGIPRESMMQLLDTRTQAALVLLNRLYRATLLPREYERASHEKTLLFYRLIMPGTEKVLLRAMRCPSTCLYDVHLYGVELSHLADAALHLTLRTWCDCTAAVNATETPRGARTMALMLQLKDALSNNANQSHDVFHQLLESIARSDQESILRIVGDLPPELERRVQALMITLFESARSENTVGSRPKSELELQIDALAADGRAIGRFVVTHWYACDPQRYCKLWSAAILDTPHREGIADARHALLGFLEPFTPTATLRRPPK